jgi:putative ABC transport system permease protein
MDQSKPSFSTFIEDSLLDIKFAIRVFRRSPMLYSAAIITLAMGIGANTAVFSIIQSTLLNPLPFKDADRIALLWQTNPGKGIDISPASLPNALDWRAQSQSFEDMGAWTSYTNTKFNLTTNDEPELVQYALVSSNFFSVLGVKPTYGRIFSEADDEPERERPIILSHNLWQRRFGADPSLVGKPITIEEQSYTVVGILPPDFRFVSFPQEAEVWIPIALDQNRSRRYVRSIYYLGVIGKMKPGVTVEKARTEMDMIASRLQQEYPDTNFGWRIKVTPLHEQVVGNIRPILLILLAAVGVVLLIVTANVANLLLARAESRQREIALRAAMGAGRARIIRQLLLESLFLAFVGGLLGMLVAEGGIKLLASMPYGNSSPYIPYSIQYENIGLDGRLFAVSMALTFLIGIVFGLVPALQSTKLDLHTTLKEGSRQSSGGGRQGFRRLLVISEVALSLMLLIGASLLVRSFWKLLDVNPGFQPDNVLTMDINLIRHKYTQESEISLFYKTLLDRFRGAPEVSAVGAVNALPLTSVDQSTIFYLEGQSPDSTGKMPQVHHRVITTGYLKAMGISLLKGRDFNEQDIVNSPRVIVINEAMSRRFWPNENPIGKRIALGTEVFTGAQLNLTAGWREIVGVVNNVRHLKLEAEPLPEAYVPFSQSPVRDMTVVIRTVSNPVNFVAAARREVSAVDKLQPVSNVKSMENLLGDSLSRPRFNVLFQTSLAGIALLLALVGVYGVTAYSVSQRVHEIGVRMALGAQSSDILRMILKEALRLAGAGIGIGLIGAWTFKYLLSAMVFGVNTFDWASFLISPIIMLCVVLLACLIPARKAAQVDPMIALREG